MKTCLIAVVISILAVCAQGQEIYPTFARETLPLNTYKIFDLGVVDANQDGRLDLFSTNCQSKPSLLIAEDTGYRDEMVRWGLQHTAAFSGFAMAPKPPSLDKPGVYAYLLFRELVLHAHALAANEHIEGEITVMSTAVAREQHNASVDFIQQTNEHGDTTTRIKFSLGADARLVIVPNIITGPMTFAFSENVPLNRIFLGTDAATATEHRTTFDFFDPHAFAWSDMNADGTLDLFVGCGGLRDLGDLSGSISALSDRMLVQQQGRLVAAEQNVAKGGCAARGAAWVDFDMDGDLDLFVTCAREERSKLYRRSPAGAFEDVAKAVGLGTGEEAFLWLDADDDRDPDLFITHSNGIWLYINNDGKTFEPRKLAEGSAPEKFTFSDFDHDGDPDIFAAAREPSSLLLVNNGRGEFTALDTQHTGLPPRALTAQWVDADNDGNDELYMLPGGLFRPDANAHFTRLRILDDPLPPEHTAKGLASWFDADNDGDLDLVRAVRVQNELWDLALYRNESRDTHWLAVDLAGTPANRQAIGARVTLDGDPAQTRWAGQAEGSLSSQGHFRLYFGLGTQKPNAVSVQWPDGKTQSVPIDAINRRIPIAYPAR